MAVTDSFFPSSDGATSIRLRAWSPDSPPLGVVQIIHGVAEHMERYEDFATFLVSKGFAVVGNDHLGHGQSIGDTKGWLAERDGWRKVAADAKKVYDLCHDEALPYFMLGHSMGSFIVRSLLIMHPSLDLTGVLLSGTGSRTALNLAMGVPICAFEKLRLGSRGVSKPINALATGSYNKKIPNRRTKNDWLTRNEGVVDRYTEDALCGFDMTVGLARDLVTGVKHIQKASNLLKMNKDLPVLFISGEMDPVSGYGKGVRQVRGLFEKAGMRHLELKLYPEARHEVLNELNNAQVYADIWDWMSRQMLGESD